MKSLSPFEQVIKGLILANFKQNVYVLCVFEKMLELADELVLQTPVDFDFGHQFLLGTALGE
jgi:hypothetical protein